MRTDEWGQYVLIGVILAILLVHMVNKERH